MNKILLYISVFFLTLAQAKAQTAETILSKLSDKVKASSGISADFTYQVTDRNNKSQGNASGTMLLKGNNYYIKQGSNEIFFDGGSVWNFNGSDEVQITSQLDDVGTITPNKLMNGNFTKGFTAKLVSSAGSNYNIELIPTDKRQNFNKINLFVSKATSLITGANVVDKNGSTTKISITNVKTNVAIPDSKFRFDIRQHPGIEVIG